MAFNYDWAGRVVGIGGYVDAIAYNGNDTPTSIVCTNGVSTTYTPDARNRIQRIQVANGATGESILDLAYAFTRSGNVSSVTNTRNGIGTTLTYRHDAANQLVYADVITPSGTSTVQYVYDGVGNRVSESWSGVTGAVQYAYQPGNFLRLMTRANDTYSWGQYGQLTGKTDGASSVSYGYDPRRMMSQVSVDNSVVARYEYDALGRRVKAVEGATSVIALHFGNNIVYEERKTPRQTQQGAVGVMIIKDPGYDDPVEPIPDPIPGDPVDPPVPPEPDYDVTLTKYLTVGGRYLAKMVKENSDPWRTYFLHVDTLGSIRAITDSAGQLSATFEYEPFGTVTLATGTSASGNHRFTGKPQDGTTGLYYFGARYYDPQAGRFTTEDPARQGLNWYVYCASNPLTLVDPDGRATQTATWAAEMSWLAIADGCLPFADILYVGSTAVVAAMEYGPVIWNNIAAMISRFGGSGGGTTQRLVEKSGSGSSNPGDPSGGPRFRAFTRSNFRHNLEKLTGQKPPSNVQAHHVFPEKFVDKFSKLGINIHDPKYGTWWSSPGHQANAPAWQKEWESFFSVARTAEEAFAHARELAAMPEFSLTLHF